MSPSPSRRSRSLPSSSELSFNDLFYFNDSTGEWRMSLQLHPLLPLGTLADFQAVVATGMGTRGLTNSVSLEIVEF